MRLHESLQFYITSKTNDDPAPDQSVLTFIKTFSRGSGPYRRILEYSEVKKVNLVQNNSVKNFFEFVGTPVLESLLLSIVGPHGTIHILEISNVNFYSNTLTTYWV
jgi:hypothetical protein